MTKDEALKQWADDVSKAYDILAFGHTERAAEILAQTRNAMRKALAQPAPVQEPVAWMTPDGEGFRIRFSPPVNDVPLGWDALYTTPPQRKPLTDEQTVALIKQCRDAFSEELAAYDIAPPIYHVKQGYDNCVDWLAAHGIKE